MEEADGKQYALIYTNFINFKYFNDVFGYSYGDSILSSYSKILLEKLDSDELCGRVSADNFVLLLKYEHPKDIAIQQRKANMEIQERMQNAHHQVLSTCCGICCISAVKEPLNIGGYIGRANLARSTIKSKQNPNYMYYDESIRTHLMEEKRWKAECRRHWHIMSLSWNINQK